MGAIQVKDKQVVLYVYSVVSAKIHLDIGGKHCNSMNQLKRREEVNEKFCKASV